MSKVIRVFLSTVLVVGAVVSFILVWMWFWLALVENGEHVIVKGAIVFIYAVVLISLIRLKVADL